MLSLLSVVTMAVLASVPASATGDSWVKDGQVYVRFYDLSKIYGPLKFYVSSTSCPAASGCAACPTGTNAEYVVAPEMVWQEWPQGGKYLEVHFPQASVGDMDQFGFTAVSVLANEERFLGTGFVPTLTLRANNNNNGKK